MIKVEDIDKILAFLVDGVVATIQSSDKDALEQVSSDFVSWINKHHWSSGLVMYAMLHMLCLMYEVYDTSTFDVSDVSVN